MLKYTGYIRKIRYYSESSHYIVALLEEIIKYLSSPLFKGIGPTQAKYIVDALGENALSLIKEDKHHLDLVKGMTVAKRELIYEVLTSNDYDQEVTQFFMGHGISLRHIGIIQETYKEKATVPDS